MKPVRTTTWADFVIRAIKVATIKMKPAYIKPQESLAQKLSISSESWHFNNFIYAFTLQMTWEAYPLFKKKREYNS